MQKLNYVDITYKELAALDRDTAIFFSALSPLETHADHLPFGTDIFIAESIRDKVIELFGEKHPGHTAVILPTIPFGANAIPVAGSIAIRYKVIMDSVYDTGESLRKLGFKYWLLTDNHGGPAHQVGIELSSRRLAKKGFHVMAPFNLEFRAMVALDPEFLAATGLAEGSCGDCTDSHAGRNETSIMRYLHPGKVRDCWKDMPPAKVSPKKLPSQILDAIGALLETAGAKEAATDFKFLSAGLAWTFDPEMDPYQGAPSQATPEAGKAMFDYRVGVALDLLESAIAGNRKYINPLAWHVRFLRDVM